LEHPLSLRNTHSLCAIALVAALSPAAPCFSNTAVCFAEPPASERFRPERADFAVKFKNEITSLRTIGVYVLPGEWLTIETEERSERGAYSLRAGCDTVTRRAPSEWTWIAPPKPGLYSLCLARTSPPDSITMNVFVMVPYERLDGEELHGYHVGCYPDPPRGGRPSSPRPRGFIQVTPDNEDTLVSPHFRLKQFLCKQAGDYPKYVILRERLLIKLERILRRVNEEGHDCDTFHIMSGYRTPHYNEAIGNVKYSRHLWGEAADFFVDENPKDGMMDDLNRDGRIDIRDARVLYDIIDDMLRESSDGRLLGGLGKYGSTAAHGPFVHTDVRGARARW